MNVPLYPKSVALLYCEKQRYSQSDGATGPRLGQEMLLTDHAMRPGYDYGDEFEFGLDFVLDAV